MSQQKFNLNLQNRLGTTNSNNQLNYNINQNSNSILSPKSFSSQVFSSKEGFNNNSLFNSNDENQHEESIDSNFINDVKKNYNDNNFYLHPSKVPRYEEIEQRIQNAEKIIESINTELKNKGFKEISKMNEVLKEVHQMKENIRLKAIQDRKNIESQTKDIAMNSLLMVNNEKIKV